MNGLTLRRPQHLRAVSSVYGKIEHVLLAYPGGQPAVSPQKLSQRYAALFRSFGDRVQFTILGSHKPAQQAPQAYTTHQISNPHSRIHLLQAPSVLAPPPHRFRHSQFIQDTFIPLQAENGWTYLLSPWLPTHAHNAAVLPQLSAGLRLPILQSNLLFEGGNILIGDDYALIGLNLLERNRLHLYPQDALPTATPKITQAFSEALGLPFIIWVGQEPHTPPPSPHYQGPEALQPFFHLDLFLTLTGKTPQGDEGILIAQIHPHHIHHADPRAMDQLLPLLTHLNTQLDHIAHTLSQSPSGGIYGPRFQVTRLPMTGTIHTTPQGPTWIPYSYNNAHIEQFQGITRAYLPSYTHMQPLESHLQSNPQHYHLTHLRLIPDNFADYAHLKGSLHCLVKVLSRT